MCEFCYVSCDLVMKIMIGIVSYSSLGVENGMEM